MKKLLAASAFAALLVAPALAQAQWYDRLSLHVDGGPGGLFAGANAPRFGVGGYVAGRIGVRLVGPLGLQVGAGGAWLVPTDSTLPPGQLFTATGGIRLAGRVGRGAVGGPFGDVNAGLALTGGLVRFGFDVGFGWEFLLGNYVGLGPLVRFGYIAQPADQASPDGAPMFFGGLSVTVHIPTGSTTHTVVAPPPPPPDTDRDGVPDNRDRCPTEPEDADGFQDDDGCPDPDNDSDGITDDRDRCRDAPETRNGFEDEDGCPDTPPPPPPPPPPPAQPPAWRVLERTVLFANARSAIRRPQRAVLAEVCAQVNAAQGAVRVVGHADERGSAAFNQSLSAARAGAVASALVRCGVDNHRLEIIGRGQAQPECSEDAPACHTRNRRVHFELEPR